MASWCTDRTLPVTSSSRPSCRGENPGAVGRRRRVGACRSPDDPVVVRGDGGGGRGCRRGRRRRNLVAAGEAMLSPSFTRTLLSHLGNDVLTDRRRYSAQRLTSLTDREREVATAVGSGASNAEVAASLFMSEATVKAHVSRLLTKLAVTNRVHIAILVHDAQS